MDGVAMGNLTIRNLDDRVKTKIRMRAAKSGRSMEEEARRNRATVVALWVIAALLLWIVFLIW